MMNELKYPTAKTVLAIASLSAFPLLFYPLTAVACDAEPGSVELTSIPFLVGESPVGESLSSAAPSGDAKSSGDTVVHAVTFGTKLISWDSQHGETGTQVRYPVSLVREAKQYSLGIKSSWMGVDRQYETNNDLWGGTKSGWTDTSLSGEYRSKVDAMTSFRVRADINLPTGDEMLVGREVNTAVQTLFVDTPYWGEGLNVLVDGSLTRALNDHVAVGLGLVALSRGSYNHNAGIPDSLLDPGDRFAASVNGTWSNLDVVTGGLSMVSLTAKLTTEEPTQIDGVDIYQRGNAIEIAASWMHRRGRLTLMAQGSYSSRGHDSLYDQNTGALAEEASNSATPLWSASIGGHFVLRPGLTIRTTYRHIQVERNEYDALSSKYLPSRDLDQIDVGGTWAIGKKSSVDLTVSAFQQNDGAPVGYAGAKYNGTTVSLAVRQQF